jgi:hypothetical protein
MLRVLLLLVPLALAVYALVDCISSKDDEIKHLPKLVWILLIVLATVVGPLAWLFAGRDRAARRAARGGGWVAPDDNPEFLRSLGEERRPASDDRDGKDGPADGADGEQELLKDWEDDLRRREEELRQQESRDRNDRGDGRDGDDGAGPSDAPPPGGTS